VPTLYVTEWLKDWYNGGLSGVWGGKIRSRYELPDLVEYKNTQKHIIKEKTTTRDGRKFWLGVEWLQ